ncbi:MAG: PhnE/PtxC family ABC transporter permease [Leptospirales bacterium]
MEGSLWNLLGAFFPPDLGLGYLLALVKPVFESVGMAAASMTIAAALSLPLGLAIALRIPGSRPMLHVLSALRAIPDLTLGIFCVVLVGIGPGAGTLALAIFYTAAVSKIYSDLFATAQKEPLAALEAAGASRAQLALYGLLPLKRLDLLTYSSYELESAIRASVIIGAVGGGGLGTELVGTIAALDFHRAATLILILVLVIGLTDWLSKRLRTHPKWALFALLFGAFSLVRYGPNDLSLIHSAKVFFGMFPPTLSKEDLLDLPGLLAETFEMALGGTAMGFLFAAILGTASARTVAPSWLAIPVRRILELLRAVPEVVWGLILIAISGVGPITGALALGIHSIGCLARLFAESIENVPTSPVVAIRNTGAPPFAALAFAVIPLASGPIAVHGLFRLEWNLRMAAVMGLIGAGGIGQALYNAQQLFFYKEMLAYILITWAIVMLVDHGSARIRKRIAPEDRFNPAKEFL